MIEFLLDFCVYDMIEILLESVEFLLIKIFIAICNDVVFHMSSIKHMRCVWEDNNICIDQCFLGVR